MKKVVSLFLVFSMLVLSIPLTAKEKKGADLVIQKTDGTQIRGELIAVKKNSLVLLGLSPMVDVTVDMGEIKMIRVVRKSKLLEGVGIGFLTGCVFNSIAMSKVESGDFALGTEMVGGIGGLSCVILGIIVGASAGTDEKILIKGKNNSEIQLNLDKLRKKARIRNYK